MTNQFKKSAFDHAEYLIKDYGDLYKALNHATDMKNVMSQDETLRAINPSIVKDRVQWWGSVINQIKAKL